MADYAIHDTTLEAIADTIRKKDGTQALIDPADYADRINLMGMLEEKTIVSSPIADFSDGADDVPTKSLVVTIAPTLSGKSEVVCSGAHSGNFYNLANGRQLNLALPKGTTIYCKTESPSSYIKIYMRVKGASTSTVIFDIVASMGVRSYTLTDDIEYLTMTENNYNTLVNGGYKIMISLESDGDYTPYQTPTQYTASLGRTIYGGTADIVKGVGKETYAEIDMGDLTWTYDSTYSRFISSSLPDCIKIDTARTTPILCSAYQVISDGRPISQVPDKSIYLSFHSSGSPLTDAFVHDSDYTDATAFKTAVTGQKIVYQLKESAQTDFTFTGQEVNTRLGYNAFWSDEGDTEVTYRSSGTIHQYPRGEEASF